MLIYEAQIFGFYLQGHTLQVGQCLPKTCSPNDVKHILSLDATAMALKRSNEVTVSSVRRVPGDYNIWDDSFFHFFMYGLTFATSGSCDAAFLMRNCVFSLSQ